MNQKLMGFWGRALNKIGRFYETTLKPKAKRIIPWTLLLPLALNMSCLATSKSIERQGPREENVMMNAFGTAYQSPMDPDSKILPGQQFDYSVPSPPIIFIEREWTRDPFYEKQFLKGKLKVSSPLLDEIVGNIKNRDIKRTLIPKPKEGLDIITIKSESGLETYQFGYNIIYKIVPEEEIPDYWDLFGYDRKNHRDITGADLVKTKSLYPYYLKRYKKPFSEVSVSFGSNGFSNLAFLVDGLSDEENNPNIALSYGRHEPRYNKESFIPEQYELDWNEFIKTFMRYFNFEFYNSHLSEAKTAENLPEKVMKGYNLTNWIMEYAPFFVKFGPDMGRSNTNERSYIYPGNIKMSKPFIVEYKGGIAVYHASPLAETIEMQPNSCHDAGDVGWGVGLLNMLELRTRIFSLRGSFKSGIDVPSLNPEEYKWAGPVIKPFEKIYTLPLKAWNLELSIPLSETWELKGGVYRKKYSGSDLEVRGARFSTDFTLYRSRGPEETEFYDYPGYDVLFPAREDTKGFKRSYVEARRINGGLEVGVEQRRSLSGKNQAENSRIYIGGKLSFERTHQRN